MNPYCGKRALDLLAAGTACLVFAPLVAGITLTTWLDDGGPTFFSQPRVGRDRHPFTIHKFSRMRTQQTTRLGRLLRRLGLDELPQFINVLRGDMSVVGPRPLTAADVELLGWSTAAHDWRFAARPGITGMSQLMSGRGSRSSRRLDRLYLRRQSPLLDLQLISLSIAVNLVGKRRIRRWIRDNDGN